MIDPKIQRFTEWLSTPKEERVPPTQVELAKELGVHETQLSRWRKELDLQSSTPPSEITALRDHIISSALKSSPDENAQLQKLAWQIANPEKKDARENIFTADDYINAGNKLIEQLRNSYREGSRSCPVCGQHKPLRQDTHLDTEPEHEEDREVATVAVPSRPE